MRVAYQVLILHTQTVVVNTCNSVLFSIDKSVKAPSGGLTKKLLGF